MYLLDSRLTALDIKPFGAPAFGTVPENEIRQLERELGRPLPEDYRWFLQRYGTSSFKFAVSSPTFDGSGSWQFGNFYGSDASNEGVLSNYIFYEGQFPKELVPIADDGMGNLFLLTAFGSHRGCIYYWGHDDGCETYFEDGEESTCGPEYPGMELMATSFTDFVLALRLDE